MKQVLIIGRVWIENTTGAGNRMLQLIDFFQNQNFKLSFACSSNKSENSIDLFKMGIEEIPIELNSSSFDTVLKKINPTIVLFDRFLTEEQFGWRVSENCPQALRILDTEDLHFLRKVRHQKYKNKQSFSNEGLLKSDETKREIASILRCDLSLIISSYEMELLRSVFKIDENILHHLPFLFDRITDKDVQELTSFEERSHFVFIGNYLHKPNVDAVLTLKRHIWKNIRKLLPKAEIHIYGAYASQQILQLHSEKEDFLIKGFAKDSLKVIEEAKVVLAPLNFGAGIKGKLTEAMICGTPSVTTKIGAEGMHNNLSWNGFITNDYNEFSNNAVELYSNKSKWEISQKNGFEIINSIYYKEDLSPVFIKKIRSLQNNLEEHRTKNFLGSLLQYQTLQATKYMSKWIEEKNKD